MTLAEGVPNAFGTPFLLGAAHGILFSTLSMRYAYPPSPNA